MAEPSVTSLQARYEAGSGRVLMTGLHALARLPLDLARTARRDGKDRRVFVSGYEGSPLAGYDLELQRQRTLLSGHGVEFSPAVNEELAVNAVQGSQWASGSPLRVCDGVTGLWYGKAPGLDRASDAMRHANLGGADPDGGALALVGDDTLAKSSTVPSSSEMALADLGLPVLTPADPSDILLLGLHGASMSRFCGLWVALKLATNVVDGASTVDLDGVLVDPHLPSAAVDGKQFRHTVTARFLQPTLGDLERSLFGARLELARRYIAANALNRVSGALDGARYGVVVPGHLAGETHEALALLGLRSDDDLRAASIRLLVLGAVHPLVPAEVHSFTDGLEAVLVVEEKRPFVEDALRSLLYGGAHMPLVLGKRSHDDTPLLPVTGDLDAVRIAEAIQGAWPSVAARSIPAAPAYQRTNLPLVGRKPTFCSGCPHSRSTRMPADALVGAGIGCSGMVALQDQGRVGDVLGFTQMGGEGAPWIGMAPFVSATHMFQNLGDGTFHHSGSLAVRAAVAAGRNVTYKLLYNSAVAMTGGQQAVGRMDVASVARSLLAEGVTKIVVTTDDPARYRTVQLPRGVAVRHRDRLDTIQADLAATPGVTVLIHDQECATELRRKRKRKLVQAPAERVFINPQVCEGCGDCGAKSGCVSVQPVSTELGRKTAIHQASCNKDFSCLLGDCPSFVLVRPGTGKTRPTPRKAPVDMTEVPAPDLVVPREEASIRITGIGGTGVVTMAQILRTAGAFDGLHVVGLDQTGLAQKGGAVVSDVRVMSVPRPTSNRLSRGGADLYLACDLLVGHTQQYVDVMDSDRTVAVVSTSVVPTPAMVVDVNAAFPLATGSTDALLERARPGASRFVDARAICLHHLGDDQFANILLLGVAFQLGTLPITDTSIEAAIRLNGVAPDANVEAFRLGRLWVADRSAVEPSGDWIGTTDEDGTGEAPMSPEALDAYVAGRTADLVAYQSSAYAQRYVAMVDQARAAEARRLPGSTDVTEAVARYAYKLMAYKDEYEVARLTVDGRLADQVAREFGEGADVTLLLHPPALRTLGLRRKLRLGRWSWHVLAVLRRGRVLRGTALDPFGYARVRRVERSLSQRYQADLPMLLDALTSDSVQTVLAILRLPDLVRGYEDVKLSSVELYEQQRDDLLGTLTGSGRVTAGRTAPEGQTR